ncbi:uncharacterized protein LOC122438161 isoform X2 [Cervus canadensis]|uniref:uncharacterized protein LOC122438161 isoform X2 n=1 Tax=Cervus canadensis TaxID=1574408 RepID=UPI001C9E89CD|nr:uncharacterized protein LOC122438161 isoform X2 [Cervus canadensis]XP_043318702.1 uncharacterized protein LOC122438161 isoform X2 [Cervus canadensis]
MFIKQYNGLRLMPVWLSNCQQINVPHLTPTLITWINHLHSVSWHNRWKGTGQRTLTGEPPRGGPRSGRSPGGSAADHRHSEAPDLEASPPTPRKQTPPLTGALTPAEQREALLDTQAGSGHHHANPTPCCKVLSVVSDSVRPHRRQPTRLPRPWDSPGRNTGVGCHCLLRMRLPGKGMIAQVSGPTSPTGEQTPEEEDGCLCHASPST